MAVVWYRFRAEARRGWKAWLALGILIGLGSGAVLALLAGARRTDSAIDRFVAQANPWDVQVTSGIPGVFDFAQLDLDKVAALPGVVDSSQVVSMNVAGRTSKGRVVFSSDLNFIGDPTGRLGTGIDRVKLLEGRLADPAEAEEVIVSFRAAEAVGLDLGDTISANFLGPDETAEVFAALGPEVIAHLADRATVELSVVGIYATVRELVKTSSAGIPTDVRLTPAAVERYGYAVALEQRNVVLAQGPVGLPQFLEGVQSLAGGEPVFTGSLADFVDGGQDAARPVSRALVLGGLLLGIVVLLLGGQTLARQAGSESGDDPTLVALGFTAARVVAVRALKAAAIGAAAAVTAAAVAVAVSSRFPIGLAELVEPDPGVRLDVAVLSLGVLAVVIVFALLGTVAGWWGTRRVLSPPRAQRHRPPPRMTSLLAGAGARPPLLAGVRAALGGGSGGVLSASVGTIALGLLATIGATAFGASLGHLTRTPVLYGWNWDVRIGHPFAPALGPEEVAALSTDQAVAALAVANEAEIELDGRRIVLLGIENVAGYIEPSMISGRAAGDVGEVVVSPGVARIGDRLAAGFGGARTELRVVGTAALPDAGAAATLETLRLLAPDAPTQLALVRVSDPTELAAFVDRATRVQPPTFPTLDEEVANFGRVEHMPLLLAALMGLVAVGTLLHALLLSVGRRRQELAVLKALGFTRRQLLGTVAAQGTTLTALSLALGLPLGIALGRGLWLRFAESLGVVPVAVVPALAITGVILGSLLVANVAAVVPGWRAARIPAALALRTE